MNAIIKYLQDTRAELRHVAWPTRVQTITYTVLVAAFSIFVALYLGLFDYIFTNTLTRALSAIPEVAPIEVVTQPAPTGTEQVVPAETVPASEGGATFEIPTE